MPLDSKAHNVVDAMLPWYVNGTLDAEEHEYVRLHLEQCAPCRQEVSWLRELHLACEAAGSVSGPSDPLRKFRQHLATRPAPRRWLTLLSDAWRRSTAWTRWSIAALLAAVAITFAGSALHENGDSALYRTLGASTSPARAGGSVVIVFEPSTTEAELRRILREAGARVVDGPTSTNAYVLDIPSAQRTDAMQALRKERAVVLVESLGPGNSP
jgi:hypothetical protein